MHFGLTNAPAIFPMEVVLETCIIFARVCIDGILTFSRNWEEHLKHIRKVLECVRKAGLTAYPQKCEWG